MSDKKVYSMDILAQSLSVQNSLASLNKLVLENHPPTHVTGMMNNMVEITRYEAIGKLLKTCELHNIRGK